MFQRRTHPSSWLLVVFRVRGKFGHGLLGSTGPSTGLGMISICVTLLQPCMMGSADAVRACVATTDDQYVLVFGGDALLL